MEVTTSNSEIVPIYKERNKKQEWFALKLLNIHVLDDTLALRLLGHQI
jgi:hypothetical protein